MIATQRSKIKNQAASTPKKLVVEEKELKSGDGKAAFIERIESLPIALLHQYCQVLLIYYHKNTRKTSLISSIQSSLSTKFTEFPSLYQAISSSLEEDDDDARLLSYLNTLHQFIFLIENKDKIQQMLKRDELYSLCKAFSCGSISSKRKEELTIILIERIIYDILPNYLHFNRLSEYLIRYAPKTDEVMPGLYLNLPKLLLTNDPMTPPITNDHHHIPAKSSHVEETRKAQEEIKDSRDNDRGKEKEEEEDKNDQYSLLSHYLNHHNLSSKKPSVHSYRKGTDLYTQQVVDDIVDQEIDHILERQFLAFSVISGCSSLRLPPISPTSSTASSSSFYDPIKEVINDLTNLNITTGSVNSSKGQVWKEFIKEERQTSYPRDVITIMMSETNLRTERIVSQYLDNIIKTTKQTFPIMIDQLHQLPPPTNLISNQKFYDLLIERLQELWQKTGFEDYDKGVMTRRMKKYNKIK